MTSTKEKIKNVMICLLLVGMVYLTYAVWFYDSPFGELHFDSIFNFQVAEEDGDGNDSDLDRFGIRPLAMVIKDENGRRGASFSSEKSDEMYFALRDDISHCISSAAAFETTDAEAWKNALLGGGVLMDYRAEIPVSAVRLWLDASSGNEWLYGRYYLLSTEKGSVEVYVKSLEAGKVYRAMTSVSSEELKNKLAGIQAPPVSVAAAREEKEFQAVMPELVISENMRELPILSAYNSLEIFSTETLDAVLRVFGLSDVTPTRYAEQDGTEVYVADLVTLKIAPSGIAIYTDTREEADEILGIKVESDGEMPTMSEKIEAARKLTASLASRLHGEGGIYIASISDGAEGTEIIFGRHVGGVAVDMRETLYFSSILIKGKSIRTAKFNLCGYEKTQKVSSYIPERIAAAAVRTGEKGDLNLRYRDNAQPEIAFAWYLGGIEKENKKEA